VKGICEFQARGSRLLNYYRKAKAPVKAPLSILKEVFIRD
jgi:hypothetical protein